MEFRYMSSGAFVGASIMKAACDAKGRIKSSSKGSGLRSGDAA